MSTRLSQHPGRTAALTLAAGVVFAGMVGGVAAADPPALNRDQCAATIAAAGVWPGTVSIDGDEYRLVSDSFTSYLSERGGCAADLATR
jgi:hypothetical protein